MDIDLDSVVRREAVRKPVVIDVRLTDHFSVHGDEDVKRTVALSARPYDARCERAELSLSIRRQFDQNDGLRRARIDVRASRSEIGTREHRPDTAVASDPQARMMTGSAAADEKHSRD
jgi:hypothetical protein